MIVDPASDMQTPIEQVCPTCGISTDSKQIVTTGDHCVAHYACVCGQGFSVWWKAAA